MSENNQRTSLSMYKTHLDAQRPVQQNNCACFDMYPIADYILQPGEWRGIHFGIHFSAGYQLTASLTVHHNCTLRSGLSVVDDVVDLTSHELSIVLQNITQKCITIPKAVPVA